MGLALEYESVQLWNGMPSPLVDGEPGQLHCNAVLGFYMRHHALLVRPRPCRCTDWLNDP